MSGNISEIQFEYFSCVKGHVVQRYGTPIFIGVTRTKDGWEWDESKVVAIPVSEINKYRREYTNAINSGALVRRSAFVARPKEPETTAPTAEPVVAPVAVEIPKEKKSHRRVSE